ASAVLGGGGAWFPAHMGRSFGWSATEIGLSLGITLVVAGIGGKLVTGWFVDRMYQRGYRDAQFRWYAICLVIATPLGIVATTAADPWLFLGLIGLFTALIAPQPAVAAAAL